jgi:hypothetical protein
LVGLVLALILLSFYYVTNYQKHLEYPNTGIIGETVIVSGVVTHVNTEGFFIDKYHVFSSEKVSSGIMSKYWEF